MNLGLSLIFLLGPGAFTYCKIHSAPATRLDGSPVEDSLISLDLSNNKIQRVDGLSARAKITLSHNGCPLDFSRGVLTEAGRTQYICTLAPSAC